MESLFSSIKYIGSLSFCVSRVFCLVLGSVSLFFNRGRCWHRVLSTRELSYYLMSLVLL